MKLQEAMDYLGWKKLPKAKQKNELNTAAKCVCKVLRTTGEIDYAVARDGKIIADLNFKAGIVKVIEYYPRVVENVDEDFDDIAPKEEPEEITEEEFLQIHEDAKEVKQMENSVRKDMLDFLVLKKNKLAVISLLPDEELVKLCKLHGRTVKI